MKINQKLAKKRTHTYLCTHNAKLNVESHHAIALKLKTFKLITTCNSSTHTDEVKRKWQAQFERKNQIEPAQTRGQLWKEYIQHEA